MKSCIALFLASSSSLALAQSPVLPRREVVNGVIELRHSPGAFSRAPRWTLDAKPLFIAGGVDDPDHDLTRASHIAIVPSGIATISTVGAQFYFFPTGGGPGRVLARPGQGPGEIGGAAGLFRGRGDTLVFVDGGNARINWIVPEKGFVRSRLWPSRGMRPQRAVGLLRSGEMVLSASGRVQSAPSDRPIRPKATVSLLSATADSARAIAEIGDLDIALMQMRYNGGQAEANTVVLRFTRSAIAVAWDTVIATSGEEGYTIDLRDPSGRIRSSIRVPLARRPVTQAMRDSMIAAELRRFDAPRSEPLRDLNEAKRVARETPFADSLPNYGRWFVTPNRTLWVVDYRSPTDREATATAFRQDGAIIGRLTWNGSGGFFAFDDDRVVIRQVDDDGVVSFAVHRIDRGRIVPPTEASKALPKQTPRQQQRVSVTDRCTPTNCIPGR